MASIDLKNCTLKIKDGTATPLEVEVVIGEGNLSWTERTERVYELDRGTLDTVRDGDEVPMEVKFEFRWEFLKAKTSDSLPTIKEALKLEGKASAWVSTSSDVCGSKTVDLELSNIPACTGEENEIITFPDFAVEDLSPDLKAATISASGKCNAVAPTIVREAP